MNYGCSLYFSEVGKKCEVGFWQCFHIREKLIKHPIKHMLAGSTYKKYAVEEHFKLSIKIYDCGKPRQTTNKKNDCTSNHHVKKQSHASCIGSVSTSLNSKQLYRMFGLHQPKLNKIFANLCCSMIRQPTPEAKWPEIFCNNVVPIHWRKG